MNSLIRIARSSSITSRIFCFSRNLTTQNHTKTSLPPTVLAQSVFLKNPWIWQQNDLVKSPVGHINKIELPNDFRWMPIPIEQPISETIIEAPCKEGNNVPKQAARLIIIRRKKMKKHKLKKLRKRMKFEWAKLRQRRELQKEKAFQAVLIQKCKDAEAFSAEKYVQERIDKLNEIVIPRFWKGRRLPEFLIRQKMGLPPKK